MKYVENIAQARLLTKQVVRWARNLGMRFGGLPLRVCLMDRLARPGRLGITFYQTLIRRRKLVRTKILGIAVVRGLSPIRFQGVVAHELGHVWTALHCVRLQPWAEEGFCELLAYRFYVDLGTAESYFHARCIEENPDPIYGDGFRRMRALLGPNGIERFIRYRTGPMVNRQVVEQLDYFGQGQMVGEEVDADPLVVHTR